MTKTNEINWNKVDEIGNTYAATTDRFEKEMLTADLFEEINNYLQTCINNAVIHSHNNGVHIPREDFESMMMERIWLGLDNFDENDKHSLTAVIKTRIKFAEIDVARTYRERGDENDKDGYTYESARWDSLNRQVGSGDDSAELGHFVLGDTPSAEEAYLVDYEQELLLSAFAESSKANKRYAKIIRFMWLGYESDELAQAIGEGEKYDANVRTYVSRAKRNFKKFMDEKK